MQAGIELGFIFSSNYANMRTKKVHQQSGLFLWVFLGTFFRQKRIFGVISMPLLIFFQWFSRIREKRPSSAVGRSSSNLRAGFATSVTGRDKELLKRKGRESGIWFLRNDKIKNHATTKIVLSIAFHLNSNLQSWWPGKSVHTCENGDL